MNIQVYGYFHSPHGSVSQVAANWIRELAAKGHLVRVTDYSDMGCQFPSVDPFLGLHEKPAGLGIFFGAPSDMQQVKPFKKHKYRVGVFVSDTDIHPREAHSLADSRLTMVCVPSEFCRKIFQKAFPGTVMVVHHGIPENFMGISSANKCEKFTFLYVFQNSLVGKMLERKNLELLIEAFKVLRLRKDVNLAVKTTSNISLDISQIMKENPSICFDIRFLKEDKMQCVYDACHAYVNPSRAEGFGMTVVEAMARGLPVVSPVHTGLQEFLTPSNCCQIACGIKKTITFKQAMNHGKLYDITAPNILEGMYSLILNYDDYRKKAETQAREIQQRFAWRNVLKDFSYWCNSLVP